MNLSTVIPLALHQLAGTVWVGGMFFSLFVMRPAIKGIAETEARVRLTLAVYRRFFPWVWVAIVGLWVSGLWLMVAEQQHGVALHVHLMMGIAFLMTLIFAWLFAFPYRQTIRIATGYENWGWATSKISQVRRLMALNLALGILNLILGSVGPLVTSLLHGPARG